MTQLLIEKLESMMKAASLQTTCINLLLMLINSNQTASFEQQSLLFSLIDLAFDISTLRLLRARVFELLEIIAEILPNMFSFGNPTSAYLGFLTLIVGRYNVSKYSLAGFLNLALVLSSSADLDSTENCIISLLLNVRISDDMLRQICGKLDCNNETTNELCNLMNSIILKAPQKLTFYKSILIVCQEEIDWRLLFLNLGSLKIMIPQNECRHDLLNLCNLAQKSIGSNNVMLCSESLSILAMLVKKSVLDPQIFIICCQRLLAAESWELRDVALEIIRTNSSNAQMMQAFIHSELIEIVLMLHTQPSVRISCFNCICVFLVECPNIISSLIDNSALCIFEESFSDEDPNVVTAAQLCLINMINTDTPNEALLKIKILVLKTIRELFSHYDDECRQISFQLLEKIIATDLNWFIKLNCTTLLIDALHSDESRLVRLEALNCIESVRQNSVDTEGQEFWACIDVVDIESLRLLYKAEHVYQEAIDMDDSIFVDEDERGHGNNVMFCYDC